MTACRYLALIVLLASSLAFAPAPLAKPERRPKPITGMEGTWQGSSRLLITATRLTYHPHESPIEYVLAVNTKVFPMTYDIRSVNRVGDRWDYHGIFRIDGDTLTLCYNGAGSGRPSSFDGPGKGTFTEVYKRMGK